MKNLIIYLILTIFFQSSYAQNSFENKKILDSNDELKIENDAKKMVEYFRRLHYPYENMTADQVQSVKEEVNRIANESIFQIYSCSLHCFRFHRATAMLFLKTMLNFPKIVGNKIMLFNLL